VCAARTSNNGAVFSRIFDRLVVVVVVARPQRVG
jgi:hypothetical protein